MAQPTPIVAGQALWTYRGVGEESVDKDYYTSLQKEVQNELGKRLSNGSRMWVGREVELRVGSNTVRARLTNLDPLLANVATQATRFVAQYAPAVKGEGQDISTFVSEIIRYPNEMQGAQYESLVGIEAIKDDILRKLKLLLGPTAIQDWIHQFYPQQPPDRLTRALQERYPLLILEGEVGSGKTALARSIGDPISRQVQSEVLLFVVNAQVRGGGHVGELTQNISRAFTEAEKAQSRENLLVLMLIDEADALAQARGGSQTHHEDDAGVNTLIQRIDRLRGKRMAILFATNLAQSLDAAIMRRAISAYHFDRPTDEQRALIFRRMLANTGISEGEIGQLVAQTGRRPIPGFGEGSHRFTYSDISQRIIPRAVETAIFAKQRLSMVMLVAACKDVAPTPEMPRRTAN